MAGSAGFGKTKRLLKDFVDRLCFEIDRANDHGIGKARAGIGQIRIEFQCLPVEPLRFGISFPIELVLGGETQVTKFQGGQLVLLSAKPAA